MEAAHAIALAAFFIPKEEFGYRQLILTVQPGSFGPRSPLPRKAK